MSSATRRTSTGPGFSERKDLGDPYQVYTEIVNVGKNLEGSKKKIKWIFGFSESDEEFEVIVLHSIVSGKKTIYENGREIVSSTSVMSTEFSHGWSSPVTYRMYRVEITVQFTSEHVYLFSIDGQPFTQLPDKATILSRAKHHDNSRYGSEVQVTKPSQRASISAAPSSHNNSFTQSQSAAPRRASTTATQSHATQHNKQQQTTAAASLFDKVDNSSSDATFAANFDAFDDDPFGGSSSTTTAQHTKPSPISGPPPSTAPKRRESTTPGNFGTPTNKATPPAKKAEDFDFFSDPAPAPTNTNNNNNTSSSNFDPFSNNKSSASSHATSLHAHSNNDFFGDNAAAAGNKGKRASAQEISLDFAGLTFETQNKANNSINQSSAAASNPFEDQFEESQQQPVPAEPPKQVDVWTTDLVDLNLRTDKPQRRTSAAAGGPSLDNLLVGSSAGKKSSFTSQNQVNPNDLLASMNDPFGAPTLLTAAPRGNNFPPSAPSSGANYGQRPTLTPALAISSLGGPGAPPVAMGYNNAYGQHQPGPAYNNQPRGPAMNAGGYAGTGLNHGQMQGQGYNQGGPMMTNPRNGMASTNIYAINSAVQNNRPQQPNSSLDSLDWRSQA